MINPIFFFFLFICLSLSSLLHKIKKLFMSSQQIQLHIANVNYKRKDPVFWIDVKTDLTKYRHKQKRVPRYYSELEKLHDQLVSTLDDVLIPALPSCPSPRLDKEGALVGRQWWFTIRLPTETTLEHKDTGVVENKIQLWLDRIAEHERAKYSEGLREFVESEVGFRPKTRYTKSRQLIINASEQDMEPEFGFWIKELATYLQNLQHMATRIENLALQENELAQCWLDLSSSWVSYGGIERNPSLFILYKSIAKGYQQVFNLERSQAIALNDTFGDEVEYQIRNCSSTQIAMQRRLTALSEYLSSRKHTESSLRSVERLKSSVNIDRDQASNAIAILENARIDEKENLKKFKRIDGNIRNDIEHNYKQNSEKDMLRTIREYAQSQLHLEKKKLLVFEDILNKKL
ncbi:unnamed protein product [Mucor hiemalis]